jgi:prepilin-type N-terminal cleavage/methylation domain-containing protein
MKTPFRNRRGYTLIEVATSVVIVAALTAAVLPVVVKQIDDAEPTRLANDLNSISKGIETFHLNVRPTYPSDLYQLTTPITLSSVQAGDGGVYLQKYVNAWKGPYITSNVVEGQALKSAFSADILTPLRLINSTETLDWDENTNPQLATASSLSGYDFLGLRINGLTEEEFNRLDAVIDGAVSSSTGRLRFAASGTVLSGTYSIVTFFLAVPIG